jgi:acyl-CoA thioesterase I
MHFRRAGIFFIPLFIAALVLTFAITVVSPSTSVDAQTATVRIMPLGDSITTHIPPYNSYRRPLWHMLDNAGYNVDFVGSRRVDDSNRLPSNTDFDLEYEGHPGWRVDNILGSIRPWADAFDPDIVLVHLGTNDLIQGQSVDSTISELGQLIDTLRASNPNVTILMAQIIPFNRTNGHHVPTLNSRIASLVSARNTSQSRVILVDQYSGFNTSTDTFDGTHPNVAGEQKLANRWYAALQNVLRSSGAQPTATRTPTRVPTRTPAPTQQPTAIPTTATTGLYRAINLGGPRVTINGQAWEAQASAANFSATISGSQCWTNPVLVPTTTVNRSNMLRCSVYGGQMNLTMGSVPNGGYDVYLYIWEDNASVTTNISLEGRLVRSNYRTGSAGTWRRLGPWRVQVSDSTIVLTTSGSWVNLSGLEVRYAS